MSGENKGLQRRFRHLVPHQLYINCRNHKLALCLKHLIKDYPLIEDVDSLLLAIWKLFHYSPRKYAIFKAIQETYGLCKLKMIRAAPTRWLSHGQACLRLVERFEQIIDTLDACLSEKYDPEVYGLRNQLLDKSTMSMVLILCDILKPVVSFSDYLQGQNVFSDMQIKCGELVQQLHHLMNRYDREVADDVEALDSEGQLYLSKVKRVFELIDDRTTLAMRVRAPPVMSPRLIVEEVAKPVTLALLGEIQNAFACSPILQAFSVFNVDKIPNSLEEIDAYGKVEIDTLADHYGKAKEDNFMGHKIRAEPLFTKAKIVTEFQGFKHQLYLYKQRGGEDVATLMKNDTIL